MNERIRELAVETGWSEDIRYAPRAKEIEKFAELLIRECSEHAVDFFNNMQSYPERVKRGSLPTVDAYILDRMGVE